MREMQQVYSNHFKTTLKLKLKSVRLSERSRRKMRSFLQYFSVQSALLDHMTSPVQVMYLSWGWCRVQSGPDFKSTNVRNEILQSRLHNSLWFWWIGLVEFKVDSKTISCVSLIMPAAESGKPQSNPFVS